MAAQHLPQQHQHYFLSLPFFLGLLLGTLLIAAASRRPTLIAGANVVQLRADVPALPQQSPTAATTAAANRALACNDSDSSPAQGWTNCSCITSNSSQQSTDAQRAAVFEELVPRVLPETSNVSRPHIAAAVLKQERAGKGRNLISMAVFGSEPKYVLGAVENALLVMRDWQPAWVLRVYHGDGVPQHVLQLLSSMGVELVHVTSNQRGTAGAMWRYFPLEDRTVSRVIFRDADAHLSARDKAAVDEWVASGRYFHTLHDHQAHANAPILGGLWGVVNGFINPAVLDAWRQQDKQQIYPYGSDQAWLKNVIWPHAKDHALQHASFHCHEFGAKEVLGFPTKRATLTDFVGNRYWPDTGYEGLQVGATCPEKCRRKQEWTSC